MPLSPGKCKSTSNYSCTAESVGRFLGWVVKKNGRVQEKVRFALRALELIEEGLIGEADFHDLGSTSPTAWPQTARTWRSRVPLR